MRRRRPHSHLIGRIAAAERVDGPVQPVPLEARLASRIGEHSACIGSS